MHASGRDLGYPWINNERWTSNVTAARNAVLDQMIEFAMADLLPEKSFSLT